MAEDASLPPIRCENNLLVDGCHVVYRDDSGVLVNPGSSVTRVRFHRRSEEQRRTRQGKASEVWPRSTPDACNLCHEYFDWVPMMIPRSRSPEGVYDLERNFCGVPCAYRFIKRCVNEYSQSYVLRLFTELVRSVCKGAFHGNRLPMGADPDDLEKYGGETTLEEFRAYNVVPDLDVNVRAPPFVTVPHCVEETYRGPIQNGRGEREVLKAIQERMRAQAESRDAFRKAIMHESAEMTDAKRKRLIKAHEVEREVIDFGNLQIPNDTEVRERQRVRPVRRTARGLFSKYLQHYGATVSGQGTDESSQPDTVRRENDTTQSQTRKRNRGNGSDTTGSRKRRTRQAN